MVESHLLQDRMKKFDLLACQTTFEYLLVRFLACYWFVFRDGLSVDAVSVERRRRFSNAPGRRFSAMSSSLMDDRLACLGLGSESQAPNLVLCPNDANGDLEDDDLPNGCRQ
ncbi:unnamed protein product [Soboliphyme baturini]|uniref:Uncharacterized protein n=1 Tax=Soboliphyme baturini TaxID=241478 RepID=A0A183J8Z6_9BILA|nr:unnamed protein product [Soboliphyme baturini]